MLCNTNLVHNIFDSNGEGDKKKKVKTSATSRRSIIATNRFVSILPRPPSFPLPHLYGSLPSNTKVVVFSDTGARYATMDMIKFDLLEEILLVRLLPYPSG